MLFDPKTPERLECGPESDRRVYFLNAPSVIARAKWRKAITEAGGIQYGLLALNDALRDGIAAVMGQEPEDIRNALLAKVDRHGERIAALAEAAGRASSSPQQEGEPPQDDGFAQALAAVVESEKSLTSIAQAISDAYPRYAAMRAADRAHDEIAGIVGARMFLCGWEGFGEALARDHSGVTEACLALIPEEDFRAIGAKLRLMTRLSPDMRKNFKSPASSPSAGRISSAGTAKNGASLN